jgi:hypothetical protein
VVPVYGLYLSLKKKIHVESHIVVPVFVLSWFSDLRQVQNLHPTRLFFLRVFLARDFIFASISEVTPGRSRSEAAR